jgi:plasmid stabilization system protein ParE
MATVLVVRDEARRELVQARDYYDEQRPGYGELFAEAIEQEFTLLLQFEKIGKQVGGGIRRHTLIHWPYGIFYRVRGNELTIIAISHHRRRPDYWRSRLR